MPHPGEIRKAQANELKNKMEKRLDENPISLLITYAIDLVNSIIGFLFKSATSFNSSGSKFIYEAVYKDGDKLITSSEKYGNMINLKFFRIILNIMYPPLGVFLARGIYGIHYCLIAMVLTYYNVLFGICFAMIITHIPSYGDRFAKYDYYRLLTIKQLIKNCSEFEDNEKRITPILLFLSFMIFFVGLLYIAFKFL